MASQKARAALANLCRLRLQQFGGRATAREIAADLNKAVEFIQPRFSDLLAAGLIRDTGERVKGQRGRPQVVWADVETTDSTADKMIAREIWADVETTDSTADKMIDRDPEQPSWFSKYGN